MNLTAYITGIQHVGIPTTKLDETIAYYEKLGFTVAGTFPNRDSTCAFLRFANLTLEVWIVESTPNTAGAINHFALNTTDIEKAFEAATELGLNFVEGSIQHIPSFWDKGIAYFNVLGPNGETIEFCQIL
ncbi:VOC family protein [Bifidobacterium psychraerophilum]|jgi:catechol 2,3-dioxygenase-like lactoylglutathione lyase family enzyme|uniref:VOC family protein n=1 Tax=Bifidobacterium psychraerophilum TaxID=218140 RepID=UPI0023F09C4E|nr:VOC family protein [Bifidobacterium psychraerophilum]MCI1659660.1 VOC family protein [Bifidobacterium psychraerophilum]MCI1805432.1 VOC family protein [Bifidobacterium psychraerophilum]MCI2176096.1 VOC family protein [Bifidobacterium psychraerophilum]MCI2182656.1 VOC family protein [Bifidobacterium psychraerophilum]